MNESTTSRNVLLAVPAKGDSKRCPGKNETLLPFTLRYAQRLGLGDRTVVSTDSPVLTDLARDAGIAACPEAPPADGGSSLFGVINAYEYAKGRWPIEHVAMLMPSYPFRPGWLLDALINARDDKQATMAIAVQKVPDASVRYFDVDDGLLVPNGRLSQMAQAPTRFEINAAIMVLDPASLHRFQSAGSLGEFWRQRCAVVEVDTLCIDVDYPHELEYFRALKGRWDDVFSQRRPSA